MNNQPTTFLPPKDNGTLYSRKQPEPKFINTLITTFIPFKDGLSSNQRNKPEPKLVNTSITTFLTTDQLVTNFRKNPEPNHQKELITTFIPLNNGSLATSRKIPEPQIANSAITTFLPKNIQAESIEKVFSTANNNSIQHPDIKITPTESRPIPPEISYQKKNITVPPLESQIVKPETVSLSVPQVEIFQQEKKISQSNETILIISIGLAFLLLIFVGTYFLVRLLNTPTVVPDPLVIVAKPPTIDEPKAPEIKLKPIALARIKTHEGSNLKLREKGNLEAKEILRIPNGTMVEIIKYANYYSVVNQESGKWVYIRYNGTEGWCWGLFLEEISK